MHKDSRKSSHSTRLIFIALALSWLCLSGQGVPGGQPQPSAGVFPGDFLEYWASARLLLAGNNPYSPQQHLAIQQSVVPSTETPLMMWNPPWTLSFILPFGLLSFSLALSLWSVSILVCLLFCSARLWRIYGGPADRYRTAWLICFSVVPAYLTLYVKQIDPLVLLGIVGFLEFQEQKRFWLAGFALTLVAVKPHLVYLLWVALTLWTLEKRQWRVLLGAAAGGLLAIIIPLIFSPDVFGYYFQLYSTYTAPRPFDWKTPTLSTALGLIFGLDRIWVRYIPPLIGLIWFTFYWRKQRTGWNWTRQMPLLLLVSQATTIFAWVWDQIVLLPALICAAVWAYNAARHRLILTGSVAFLLINVAPLLAMGGILIPSGFALFWMVPVFLLAYTAFGIHAARQTTNPTQLAAKTCA